MKFQILFSGKNKKNISKCRLLKFLPRVLRVKVLVAMLGRASSEVYLLVNFFSNLYVTCTFILRWIAFIFGRDEKEDQ